MNEDDGTAPCGHPADSCMCDECICESCRRELTEPMP